MLCIYIHNHSLKCLCVFGQKLCSLSYYIPYVRCTPHRTSCSLQMCAAHICIKNQNASCVGWSPAVKPFRKRWHACYTTHCPGHGCIHSAVSHAQHKPSIVLRSALISNPAQSVFVKHFSTGVSAHMMLQVYASPLANHVVA